MPVIEFVPESRESLRRGARVLFTKYSLHATLTRQSTLLSAEINEFATDYLLSVDSEEVFTYLESKYTVVCPEAHFDQAEFTEGPTQMDVSHDWRRAGPDRSRPVYVPATKITIHIPIEGQAEILECAPNVIYTRQGPPQGKIENQELQFSYIMEHADAAAVERRLNEDRGVFQYVFNDVWRNVSEWNSKARVELREQFQRRRASVAGLQSQMRIPLRVRKDADQSSPILRPKLVPPDAPSRATLALDQFDQILSALKYAALAFERAPSSFIGMGEEDLRHHFLIGLNMKFEGNAGAETFNMGGKTDILLRVQGKTVFIAECKFWRGPKSFVQALDQLLGYISWRDTKCALIIFNRTRRLSELLEKIPTLVRGHPNYVREQKPDDETSFRYIVHHPDDAAREVLLAVLVFEVPAPGDAP